MAQIAQQKRTPWFTEIEKDMGEHYTELLQCPSRKKRDYIISVVRNKDKQDQLNRLERECPTTTGLYRQLNDGNKLKEVKTYIKCNSHMQNGIRLIHAVRAGNSDLQAQQFPRHQASEDKCRICGISYEKETPRHVIEECQGT